MERAKEMKLHPMILMQMPSIGDGGAATDYFRWAEKLVRKVLEIGKPETAQDLYELSCQAFVDMANRDADAGKPIPEGGIEGSLEIITFAVQQVVYEEDLP